MMSRMMLAVGFAMSSLFCGLSTFASTQTLDDGDDLTNAVAVARAAYATEKTTQLILLNDGTYKTKSETWLDFPVIVRGVSGDPAKVIVEAQAIKEKKYYRVFTVDNAKARLENVTVTGGQQSYWGDGNNYYNYGAGIRMAKPNSAAQHGHSKWGDGGVVSNCVITGNQCPTKFGSGAALYMQAYSGLITHCIVTNNTCTRQLDVNQGGAAGTIVTISGGRLSNTLIAYNTASAPDLSPAGTPADQSRILSLSAAAKVENCAVVNNTIGLSYSPSVVLATGSDRIYNTLIASNTVTRHAKLIADWAESRAWWSGDAACYVNCALSTVDYLPNDTCLTAVDADFFNFAAGDLRLRRLSPLCAGGAKTGVEQRSVDLAGNPRLNGDGTIGVGTYAYDSTARLLTADAIPSFCFDTDSTTFSVSGCEGFGESPVFYWSFAQDGSVSPSDITTSYSLTKQLPKGTYPVSVTASNTVTGVKQTLSLGSISSKQKHYYVKAGNAGAAAPYDTVAKAAADIQTAIDAAADVGAEVVILPGLYEIETSIFLKKVITVRGQTGNPEDVIIRNVYAGTFASPDNTGHGRCALIDAGEKAMLASVALENANVGGTYTLCGALYIGKDVTGTSARSDWFKAGNGGCASNIIIRGAKNSNKFGHAAALCAVGSNALVTHCTITNNSSNAAFVNGGSQQGIIELELGARLEQSLVAWNKAAMVSGTYPEGRLLSAVNLRGASKMRFCTVVSNTCSLVGGVNIAKNAGARVENCLVMCNHAIESVDYYANATTRHNDWGFFDLTRDGDFFAGQMVALGQGVMADALAAEISWVAANAETVNGVFKMTYTDHAQAGDTGRVCDPKTVFRSPSRGKWTLRNNSPARDLVDSAVAGTMPSVDAAGNPRLVNELYDLGCFEAPVVEQKGLLILVK